MHIVEYIKDVKAELKHVKWPTKKATLNFSLVVVALSIATAIYLGAFDFILAELIQAII